VTGAPTSGAARGIFSGATCPTCQRRLRLVGGAQSANPNDPSHPNWEDFYRCELGHDFTSTVTRGRRPGEPDHVGALVAWREISRKETHVHFG